MINYDLELNKIINDINNIKICEILLKEDLETLKNLKLDDAIQLIKSKEIYLGNDLKDYIDKLIPDGADGYFFRVAISKMHNITYPILYNEDKNPVKSYTHNNFAIILWTDHTNDLLIDIIYNRFNISNFNKYINENLCSIYEELINYVIKSKKDNAIVISLDKEKGLVNTVKEMLKNGKLDSSYALSLVDMDKLRIHMENYFMSMDHYDEFDKLEDDLEECVDNFFKYNNDEELLHVLTTKEGFKIVDNLGLVK